MVAFGNTLGKSHGGVVIPEGLAKGESPSNGAVEGAGRLVRDFARALKAQLEKKAAVKIESSECIVQWIIRWAAVLPSRYLVGKDGLTAYERRRGRTCKLHVVPFGEK